MRSEWWTSGDLDRHIDQHRSAEGREFTVRRKGGNRGNDFLLAITVPPHDALMLRRAYFLQDTAYVASATNYWTFDIVQTDPTDGCPSRERCRV